MSIESSSGIEGAWSVSPRLAAALGLSVFVHAGILIGASLSPEKPLVRAGATAPVLHLSLVARAETPTVSTGIAPATPASPPPAPVTPGEAPAPGREGPAIATAKSAADEAPGDTLYLPAADVDHSAQPLGAPDLTALDAVQHYSGAPIRIRLFVDRRGQLVRSQVSAADPDDQAAGEAIAQILASTTFIPAQKGGRGVASFLDVDFELADEHGDPMKR